MSRTKKNKNSFESYQTKKRLNRCGLISDSLQVLKNSNLRFDNVTDLAKFLAKRISESEGEPFVSTTLLRNLDYRILLQEAFDFELKTGNRGKSPVSRSGELELPAAVRQFQIENSNLKHENARLKARLSDLGGTGSVATSNQPILNEAMRPFEHDFVNTCNVLESVMSALEGFIKIDEQGRLVDRSTRRDNVIAEARLVAPYLRWSRTKN